MLVENVTSEFFQDISSLKQVEAVSFFTKEKEKVYIDAN